MEFTDLIAIKIKELMKEKNISIYKLKSLTGVYTSTISQFLTRKTKTIRIENLFYFFILSLERFSYKLRTSLFSFQIYYIKVIFKFQ